MRSDEGSVSSCSAKSVRVDSRSPYCDLMVQAEVTWIRALATTSSRSSSSLRPALAARDSLWWFCLEALSWDRKYCNSPSARNRAATISTLSRRSFRTSAWSSSIFLVASRLFMVVTWYVWWTRKDRLSNTESIDYVTRYHLQPFGLKMVAMQASDSQAHPVRERVRRLFEEIMGAKNLGCALETCTFNVVVEVAKQDLVVSKWTNPAFKKRYCNKVRSLIFNLKNPETPGLRDNILKNPSIEACRTLVRMTHQEMHPEIWAAAYLELRRKAMQGKPEEVKKDHVGLYRCSRCKSMRTTYNLIQTRSADEPSTAHVLCGDCGKRWSMAA